MKNKIIRTSITVPLPLYDLATEIGNGNTSRGIALALQYWMDTRPVLQPSKLSQAIENDGFLDDLEKEGS